MSSQSEGSKPSRPPHVIQRDEVPDWLARSVNTVVTYHRTSRPAARAILEHGVDIEHSRVGAYGQGFYTATTADPFHGEVELAVAVRLLRPLAGPVAEVEAQVDEIVTQLFRIDAGITLSIATRIRRELRRRGYDGIIVRDAGGDGIDYVIALLGNSVKVVQP